jgi:hypothetical protein
MPPNFEAYRHTKKIKFKKLSRPEPSQIYDAGTVNPDSKDAQRAFTAFLAIVPAKPAHWTNKITNQ